MGNILAAIDPLSLLLGLCMFLFGMHLMGEALEKKAGGKLQTILEGATNRPYKGLLLGAGVTAVIQSSSATTVTVVGFVNSGMMTLPQAIYVIMGANIGTTATAWILSLSGVSGDSFIIQMLKPSFFSPIVAFVGVIFVMFCKKQSKKDTGLILLGFAILMTGMDIMSDAVIGLKDVPEFVELMPKFSNPILGVILGAVLTAIIQSSSASVGILQSLAATGQISYAVAIPIIMGQNIGTCVKTIISAIGAEKNARRAAAVHLYFNIVGTILFMIGFYSINAFAKFAFIDDAANELGIAIVHTVFNVVSTIILAPCGRLLEKLAYLTIPDTKKDIIRERGENGELILDERLMTSPAVAVQRCSDVTAEMARVSCEAMRQSLSLIENFDEDLALQIRKWENEGDEYEDKLGSYLVKLSSRSMAEKDSHEVAKLLHIIGDFERISDHARDMVESAEEMKNKNVVFSDEAKAELKVMCRAIHDILDLAEDAFASGNTEAADKVEPLEQVVDRLKEEVRHRHILRLQQNKCSIEYGFVLSDILTNLERVSDHCSNIAGCVIEMSRYDALAMHGYLGNVKKDDPEFIRMYNDFAKEYALESVK